MHIATELLLLAQRVYDDRPSSKMTMKSVRLFNRVCALCAACIDVLRCRRAEARRRRVSRRKCARSRVCICCRYRHTNLCAHKKAKCFSLTCARAPKRSSWAWQLRSMRFVPYVEFQEFMTDWDETRGFYKLEPFSDFVPEVGRRLQAKGLNKSDPGGADLPRRRTQLTRGQFACRLGLLARLHRRVRL